MKELEKLVTIKSYGWANIVVNLVSQYTSNDKYFRFLIDSMEREGIKLEQILSLTLTLALQTQSGDVVRRLISFLENSEHKQHISPEQLFNTLKSKLSFVNIIQSLAKNPNMDLINEVEFLALQDAKFSGAFKKAIKAANYHAIKEAVSNPNPKILEMLQPYAKPQNSKMKKIEKDIQRVILLESATYEDTQVFQERYREYIQNGDKVDWVFFMEALRNESAENAIFLAKEMSESELIKIISEHAYFLLRSALRNKNTECLKWLLSEGFEKAGVDLASVLSDGAFAIFAVAAKNENPEMANILFDIAKKIPMSEQHTLYNIAIMCEAYAIYVNARYTKIAGMIWEDAPLEWRILSNKRLNISGASSVDSINYDMAKWLIQRDIQVNNEIIEFDWRIAHIVLEYRSFNKHTIYNHISAPIISSIQMLIYKENHEVQPEVDSQLMLMFIQRHILDIMDSGTDEGFKRGFMPQTVYGTAASLVIYLAGRDDITHEQIHWTIKESYRLSLYEKYIQDLNLYSDGYYHTIFTIRELSFIRSGLRLEAFEILRACAVTEQISSEKEVLDIVKREAMHYLYHDVVLLLPKLSYIPNKIIMEFLVGKLQEETFTHIIGVTKFPLVGVIPSDFSIAGYIKYNNGRGLSFYQDLHKIFGDKTFDLLTERYLNEQERENIYSLATKQLSKIMKINKIVEHLMQAPYKTSFSKIVLALDPKAQAQSDYNMKYQLLMSIKFHFIIRAINEAENVARMYNIDIDTTEVLCDTLLQREQSNGEHIAILQPQQNFSQDRGFNDSGERINPMQINVNEELYDQNMFFSAMDYFSDL